MPGDEADADGDDVDIAEYSVAGTMDGDFSCDRPSPELSSDAVCDRGVSPVKERRGCAYIGGVSGDDTAEGPDSWPSAPAAASGAFTCRCVSSIAVSGVADDSAAAEPDPRLSALATANGAPAGCSVGLA